MTGEKRVVRVDVANIGVLLQAKLQRTALLLEGIGEGLANRVAERCQGVGWERCQCARGADIGDQCHGRAPGCRGSRPPATRLGEERRDVGMKRGDLAQQTSLADWIGFALSPRRMASAKPRTRRWAAMSLSDRPVWMFGAANSSLIRASAAIPTTIAAPRLMPAEKMFCGESICVMATRATV